MNNKWKSLMLIKGKNKLGGWTALPSVLWTHKDELGISNHHIVFLLEILSHDEGYIMYDCNSSVGSSKSLHRYREQLKEKGYITFPTSHVVQTEDGPKQSGFVYNLDGLLEKLVFLVSNVGQSVPEDDQFVPEDDQFVPATGQDVRLLRNHTKESYIRNSSNQKHTTREQVVVQSASSAEGATSNCTIELLYKKYLPNVKIRNADRKAIDELDKEKLTAYIPYLPFFDDPFWNSAKSTKQPSMLPAVWSALEKFVDNFPYSAQFVRLCKDLKHKGIDTDFIINEAESLAEGKLEIIKRYIIG